MSNDASRAFKLRKKWREGAELSADDDAWLLQYEARGGTSTEYTDDRGKPQWADEIPGDEAPAGLPPLEFADAPKRESEPAKKKRGRPKKDTGPAPGKKSNKRQRRAPSDFRSKPEYSGAKMDRETVCVQLASMYVGFLHEVGRRSRKIGGMALPDEVLQKIVFPAAIACADDWLPETEATPELVVGASGAFQVGAFLVAKKKASALESEPFVDIGDIEPEGDAADESPRPDTTPGTVSDD